LSEILKARHKRNILPLFVSGDYHKGALSEIWYSPKTVEECKYQGDLNPENKKVFGYELIASGLFHEGIATGLKKIAFSGAESQKLAAHNSELKIDKNPYCIDPHILKSGIAANFGCLEMNRKIVGNDYIKLIMGEKSLSKAYIWERKLDWDKPFIKENEKRKTWKSYPLSLFSLDSYQPIIEKPKALILPQ